MYCRLLIKRSRLATGPECPVFGQSGYRMSGTGIRSNLNTDSGSVFGGLLYLDVGHSIDRMKGHPKRLKVLVFFDGSGTVSVATCW
jgi:hypothetical protein